MQNIHYPNCEYISKETKELWRKMVELYGFHDGVIDKTVQNYSSTVRIICDYHKKDFLNINEKDVEEFYSYLETRSEVTGRGHLSPATVHTYKKNLQSVGNYFGKLKTSYKSPFSGKALKSDKVKQEEHMYKQLNLRDEVREEDVSKLLLSVRDKEQPQYYFILSMIACFGVSSYDICSMKGNQVEILSGYDGVRFHFTHQKMIPKAKRDLENAVSKKEHVEQIFCFGDERDKSFLEYYEKLGRDEGDISGKSVFYNRNHNPVNFKSISSVLKKHKELLNISYVLTTKELTGSLWDKKYIVGEKNSRWS